MTNREAFNGFVRDEVVKQIQAMESMTNEKLVRYSAENPGYCIHVNIHDLICLYKVNSAGAPVGGQHTVTVWMDAERTIDEEKQWQLSKEWNREREEWNNARRPEK